MGKALSCRFHSAPEPAQERRASLQSGMQQASGIRADCALLYIYLLLFICHHTAFGTGTLHTARTCLCPELLGHLEAGAGAQHNHLPKFPLGHVHFQEPNLEAGGKGHFLLPNFQHFLGITSASSIAPVLAVCRASRERSVS